MILEELSVTDFRVFQGRHAFDLRPRKKWNKKRPVVLFGGLNGAGKTTILLAVRLALYGKQSLGNTTSQKDYESFLSSCVHRSRESLLQANNGAVELTFNYAHMGVLKRYHVKRAWTVSNSQVKESLLIGEDEQLLSELSYEQAQGFLNELVPIGVSELFFFDGEKIANLAKDEGGIELQESVKKLLGLDIIARLSSDLTVLMRNQDKVTADKETRAKIVQFEKALVDAESQYESALSAMGETRTVLIDIEKHLENASAEMLSRGGAWAESHEAALARQADLSAQRRVFDEQIKELLSGYYPLSLAPDFVQRIKNTLSTESEEKSRKHGQDLVCQSLQKVKDEFVRRLGEANLEEAIEILDAEMTALSRESSHDLVIHDLSDTQRIRIESAIDQAIGPDYRKVKSLSSQIETINEQLDRIGSQIAMAPDEGTLEKQFRNVQQLQEQVSTHRAQMNIHREDARRHLREAMDTVRRLDELHQRLRETQRANRSGELTKAAQTALDAFGDELAARKVRDLEQEFARTFYRLARKDDVHLRAHIDPKSFRVTLFNAQNQPVDKNELSAGEKQIYAISVLEALARTSGRKLPIIIDTPLGRLDSKHRTKLVENYFPVASHQVIVLSTDTEVDEQFYAALYPHISHAYKLEYDPPSGGTQPTEGYFWRHPEATRYVSA